MTRATIAGGALAAFALLLGVVGLVVRFAVMPNVERAARMAGDTTASAPPAEFPPRAHPGLIYGRITDVDGETYEGRLHWGGNQEAFWSDYFNGANHDNRWAAYVPQPEERRSIEIFGFHIGGERRDVDLRRLFLARFGDIARVDAHFSEVKATLKSGTVFTLDRFSAGDIDDGVRVWDEERGVVDLDTRQIRTIEFLPIAPLVSAPDRLHGTVRTRHGDFTGLVQWNQQESVGTDTLDGRTADGDVSLRFDTIRSITRRSRESALVTLADGREQVLSSTPEVGDRNRGTYVDDGRYGRVLIAWDVFERVDFSPGGTGPAYDDFPPGRPLVGRVTTRDGRRFSGRLVYDVDESETTETLDAAVAGVDYYIPFSLIRSVVPRGRDGPGGRRTTVILHDGEELPLERTGDLRDGNAGMLIFVDGRERPEYVPWTDVEQIDFDDSSN